MCTYLPACRIYWFERLILSALSVIVLCLFSAPAGAETAETPSRAHERAARHGRATIGWHIFYIGRVFSYETGYGRVEVDARGEGLSFGYRFGGDSSLRYDYLNLDVDSYFAGAQVGEGDVGAHLLSLKTFFTAGGRSARRRARLGAEYRFLTESSYDDVHFASLFAETRLLGAVWTVGAAYRDGASAGTDWGWFGSLVFPMEEAELFIEYSELDVMRTVFNGYVAAAAENVGTINTTSSPDGALSFGARLRREDHFTLEMKFHNVDMRARPVFGVEADF